MHVIQAHTVPKLTIGKKIAKNKLTKLKKNHTFFYEHKDHVEWPHIVKFSGGRSSGMLLFILLEAGILKAERGDVIVFNNTSAEHPETYKYIKKCKEIVENTYGIPFLWVEHCTYEDSRGGEYVRLTSFRLVNSEPYSTTNPEGYHWRGEVYEEVLSLAGYLPTLFQRTCTSSMKLEVTRMFLKEWLANKPETERLGHFGKSSRMDNDALYERHLKNRGAVPRQIFLDKKKYLYGRPVYRPAQKWVDFSTVAKPFSNTFLKKKAPGRQAVFGKGGIEYLSFVGLRHDEVRRVLRVQLRNEVDSVLPGYEGEYVYTPLANMNITSQDVEDFWSKQDWDLALDANDNLSNCTYCFLKGVHGLRQVHTHLSSTLTEKMKNTPCDINWWVRMEELYGRDMKAEEREIRSDIPNDFIGFFGVRSGFFYRTLAEASDDNLAIDYPDESLPCDCTD